jgi:hypothetical protein
MQDDVDAAGVAEGDPPAADVTPAPDVGMTMEELSAVALPASEGPTKRLKTVGDLVQSYGEIVKEHSKATAELKRLRAETGDQGQKPTSELWDRALADVNQSGKLSSETLEALVQQFGLPADVWTRVAGTYVKADQALSEQTQAVLGVDSRGFNELLDQAGYPDTHRQFIDSQVLAGRFGFLQDLKDDLHARGLLKEPGKGDTMPDQTPPGEQQQQQQPAPQVQTGDPAAPQGPKPWATEDEHQREFNDAQIAENQGDNTKMDALKARMETLDKKGTPYYPGAPTGVTIE